MAEWYPHICVPSWQQLSKSRAILPWCVDPLTTSSRMPTSYHACLTIEPACANVYTCQWCVHACCGGMPIPAGVQPPSQCDIKLPQQANFAACICLQGFISPLPMISVTPLALTHFSITITPRPGYCVHCTPCPQIQISLSLSSAWNALTKPKDSELRLAVFLALLTPFRCLLSCLLLLSLHIAHSTFTAHV